MNPEYAPIAIPAGELMAKTSHFPAPAPDAHL
jgi:hypothetical protein